jgi:dUTPase
MVVAPVSRVSFGQVHALDDTERSTGGFGSTGIHSKEKITG